MKVLLVDSDADDRMVLRTMLLDEGHEIYEVGNGQEAINFNEKNGVDLVLMGVAMSEVDGYRTTRAIKEHSQDDFIPVIFLMAMTDEDSLDKCFESGADDFLFKPYDRIVLKTKVQALDKFRILYRQNVQQKNILSGYYDRMEQDQNVAEKIYSNLMGRGESDPRIIEFLHEPADKFNGDLVLSLRKPGGGINLLVGDFTGHGLGAAIGALPAAEVFLGMTAKGFSIYEIIIEINSRLKLLLPTGMFLAAVLVDVDIKEQRVSIWNGGLPELYVFSHQDNKISEVIKSSSLPLGVVDSNSLVVSEKVLKLKTGDSIVVHSDGVIETDNLTGEFYGTERFESLIESSISKGTFISDVKKSVEAFRGEELQKDDLTVVQFKFDWDFLNEIETAEMVSGRYKAASNWNFNLELGYDTLKHTDPVPLVVQFVTEIQGIEIHKGNLFTILSELIVNSLDHGVLALNTIMKSTDDGFSEYYQQRVNRLNNLNEGWIKISIKNKPISKGGEISIKISDSGSGFDFEKKMQNIIAGRGDSGRGLGLIKELSSSLNYYENNNLLEVIYQWE